MNKFLTLALLGVASAINMQKADLPHDLDADKIDPVSRYVNDDDLVQQHSHIRYTSVMDDEDVVVLVQLNKADLPHDEAADKVDPLSRYVNDDDLIQEDNFVQIGRADLPHDLESDKIDPVSRYVNDDDI